MSTLPATPHPFSLGPDSDYIELIKLLKAADIAQSGGHAKALVEAGEVSVNGAVELRKRNKLRVGDRIEVMRRVIVIER